MKKNKPTHYRLKQSFFLIVLLIQSLYSGAQTENVYSYIATNELEDRICFAMYTVHEKKLKLTAQFYPIKNFEPFEATLEIKQNNKWQEIARTNIIYPGYTAPFSVENWDDTREVTYRVVYNEKATYEGIIRKNPVDKNDFVMGVLSCNSSYAEHGGDISRKDIVDNFKKIKPDLLFFAGDQVYEHSEHLLHWLKFGRDFGDIIRNTPTICITDDHDVGQGNIWGQGGIKSNSRRGIHGGYYMPIAYINEVERAQTSHLPDPYDPTPIARGIGVYYTDLKWGGISFAILEDRKFKSGLTEVARQNPEIFKNGPSEVLFNRTLDVNKLDIKGASLLGKRQLDFLEEWTTDWSDSEMKAVLSQTIFAQVSNYTGKSTREITQDFDSNAWPQSARNKALSVIRKSFSPMIAGDQHLASFIQHGIDNFGDAGYSFATPAIANLWLRWWKPSKESTIKKNYGTAPDYTGKFLDGFGNKMTVMAVANPTENEINKGKLLSTRAAGIGIVKFHKNNRTITFECWPRNIDITNTSSKQYEGWPITISQLDNFNISEGYELPRLLLHKANQVVTIRDSYTHSLISSIRVKGDVYQPKVLKKGTYTIEIGEGDHKTILYKISATKKNKNTITVSK
ncbi:alkaline phosphatase D family protein [Aquimarina sp. ERC-38]|uniref:alkaline phosphatase D family protein n=1 Tax=Aquimarina sp. ERC-38 TaxID=2949996 RepID=UPI0022476C65|nr:alkaline phosphatase D family protein [Aquimarina sp. ERC-38]UZO82594.1 alkaline phosphatase D family protein [Aquimarina sp. ERC-38]